MVCIGCDLSLALNLVGAPSSLHELKSTSKQEVFADLDYVYLKDRSCPAREHLTTGLGAR